MFFPGGDFASHSVIFIMPVVKVIQEKYST
jgi:hypothetical protein